MLRNTRLFNYILKRNMSYSSKLIDHFEKPWNVGSFNKDDTNIGTGLVGAPACGDVMKLQIKVENDVIVDTKFKTFGCGSAIASSSYVSEIIKGKTIDECLEVKNQEIAKYLKLQVICKLVTQARQQVRHPGRGHPL